MAEATESMLVARLARLESGMAKIKRAALAGLVLLAGVGLLGASMAEEPAPALEARSFVLRDDDGRERGLLTVRDGLAVLVLKDEAGRITAQVGGHARMYPVGQ